MQIKLEFFKKKHFCCCCGCVSKHLGADFVLLGLFPVAQHSLKPHYRVLWKRKNTKECAPVRSVDAMGSTGIKRPSSTNERHLPCKRQLQHCQTLAIRWSMATLPLKRHRSATPAASSSTHIGRRACGLVSFRTSTWSIVSSAAFYRTFFFTFFCSVSINREIV